MRSLGQRTSRWPTNRNTSHPVGPQMPRGVYTRTPQNRGNIRAARLGSYITMSARNMTEPERAWVGAMVDAEGSVLQSIDTRNRLPHWRLSVEMLEPEYMSALLRATGVGNIYYRRRPQRQHPFFTWGVWRYLDILSLARQCAPYSIKLQRVLKGGDDGRLPASAF